MNGQVFRSILLSMVFSVFFGSIGVADVPTLINFRGYLADRPGTQSVEILFNLYEQDTGGTPLWTETQSVDLFDGNFAVLLGSVNPLTNEVFDTANRYLGVQVTGEDELVPRQQIVTVPYAFQSDYAAVSGIAANATQAADADTLGGIAPTGFVQPDSTAWLQRVGISSTNPNRAPRNGLEVNIDASSGSSPGITVNGAPSGGDMGIRLSNTGTGGKNWFIDSTNNESDFGGGKLSFYHVESLIFEIPQVGQSSVTPQSTEPQSVEPEQIQPIPLFRWVDVLVMDGVNNRVGILTESPQQTLDVRGTIGNAGTTYHSDKRWKENIRSLDHSLDKVKQLRGVEYDWKKDEYFEMNFSDGKQVGLIAQEVEQVIPEVVTTSEDGYKSIDYARMVPYLIESVKQQQQQIQSLQEEIQKLKREQ